MQNLLDGQDPKKVPRRSGAMDPDNELFQLEVVLEHMGMNLYNWTEPKFVFYSA